MLPPDPPYLFLTRHGRDLEGVGHRDSPLLSPETRLLLVPSLRTVVVGEVRSQSDNSISVSLRGGGAAGSPDDILALPFGATAYLDTAARISIPRDHLPRLGDAGVQDVKVTLLLNGRSLGSASLNARKDATITVNRLLPWYPGLPYALRGRQGEPIPIPDTEPLHRHPWWGRVGHQELAAPQAAPDSAASEPAAPATVDIDGVLMPKAVFERLAGQAMKAARLEGGAPMGAVHKALAPLQNPIRSPFIRELIAREQLTDLGDRLVTSPPESTLSPLSRGVLKELEDAGATGVALEARPKAFKDAASRLEYMQLAVVAGGRLAWSLSGFTEAIDALRRRNPRDLDAEEVARFLASSKSVAKDVMRRLADAGIALSTSATTATWQPRRAP